MNIIFAGTPEFAAISLQALINNGHTIVAVYTQPDRKAGRGQKLTPSPVKTCAITHRLPVYQPASLKDPEAQQQLRELNADIMVVAAYGLILPQAVLDIPRLGCINVHGSLLPRWRGAAPVQRAILEGDSQTGVTIMQMDAGLDTGAMLKKAYCTITDTTTSSELMQTIAVLGGETLLATLTEIEQGKINPQAQDERQATYAHKIAKSEGVIDWHDTASAISRKIRAFNPWPGTQAQIQDQPIKIWQALVIDDTHNQPPGSVIKLDKEGLNIAAGDNSILRITELQIPGKKRHHADVFHQYLASLLQ